MTAHLAPGRGFHFPPSCWVEYEGAVESEAELLERLQAHVSAFVAADGDVRVSYESNAKVGEQEQEQEEGGEGAEREPRRRVDIMEGCGCLCGGTHVRRLRDIGALQITKVKSKKGKTKVSYTLEN